MGISDKLKASRRPTATEDSRRLLINTTPAFIHTVLPDGSLDFLIRRWLEHTDLPLTDLLGWRWTAAIHPDDIEALVDQWRAARHKRPHPALAVQITARPAAGARSSSLA